ncbi:hypothetical protein PGTUg99_010643 [Puccinia graminis f. sp. tritici]|uniref:Uncharacterized protein n=1 Tax=Puccinia graminis f. sp. tritici TaxID=56615 RepID=A0A5B0PW11_PUCGR|nr:hypothetical protein PGTUg99_010643 [Puccinia graminis f. sp. tritici]
MPTVILSWSLRVLPSTQPIYLTGALISTRHDFSRDSQSHRLGERGSSPTPFAHQRFPSPCRPKILSKISSSSSNFDNRFSLTS